MGRKGARAAAMAGMVVASTTGCRGVVEVALPTLDPPGRVSASVSYSQVRVQWDPVAGAVSYVVELDDAGATERLGVVGTSATLSAAGDVAVRVAGVDAGGDGPFSPGVSAHPLDGPPFGSAEPYGQPFYSFGFEVASGDIDGDGIEDVLVGSPFSGPNNGRVDLFLGTTAGLAAGDSLVFPDAESNFGYSIATGDFDPDEGLEFVVGARRWDAGGATTDNVGLVRMFAGGATPFATLGSGRAECEPGFRRRRRAARRRRAR